MMKALHSSPLLALSIISAMIGLPSHADESHCGTHSVDDLENIFANGLKVDLVDGKVLGREIADETATANLVRVGDKLDLLVEGGKIPYIEFTLEKLAPSEAKDFRGAGFGASLDDIAIASGCDSSARLPQYFGKGVWYSDDGKSIPATMRFFMWLAPSGMDDGTSTLHAFGVMRSKILNGKILIVDS